MKVLNRVEWTHEHKCSGCKSDIVIEASDVRFGSFGSFDDFESEFYVDCTVCGTRLRWKGRQMDLIPPNVQHAARVLYNQKNGSNNR